MTDIGIPLSAVALLGDCIVARWLRLPVGREAWWVYGVSALIVAGVSLTAYGYWSLGQTFRAVFGLLVLAALPALDRTRRTA